MQETENNAGNPVMDALKNVRSTVETFASEGNISQLKETVKSVVKDAQKEFSGMINRDLANVKKTFAQERAVLEKELKRQSASAKKFIAAQKKEIATLQGRLEKLVKAKKAALGVGKTSKKKATKKVATRKAVKKVVARGKRR